MEKQNQCADHCATTAGLCWKTDSKAVLDDLKFLMKEYYAATYTDEAQGLKIEFCNGQSFIISVTEQ